MSPVQFLALCLASAQVVDAWRQGTLFAKARAAIAARVDAADWESARTGRDVAAPWWASLLSCWYCVSHWAPPLLILFFVAPAVSLGADWPWLPVYALAATRTIVLVNGLVPDHLKHEAAPAAPPPPPWADWPAVPGNHVESVP
jgi:hypothetical protein